MTRRALIACSILLASLAAAACRGDGDAPAPEPGAGGAALHHVHGLGVDARSGAVYVATHSGLFVAPPGRTALRRVGDSRQDIMGFSVAGPGRFLASGHPGPDQDLPPNLGLIESRDGGRSWQNVSLMGRADFHVLRSVGRTVYGVDSATGRLMVSTDGGRRWDERTPPAGLLDLAVDPRDPEQVVASSDRGTFRSRDGGRGWRALRDDVAGLLAWPAAGALYVVGGGGQVARSSDAGRNFVSTGEVGGRPVAFAGAPGGLYVALEDGTVKSSGDGGRTWLVRARP